MLYAHSANRDGDRHDLLAHLYAVAELTSRFCAPFGAAEVGWLVGLLHDCGKASCRWQQGLVRAEVNGGRVGTDHKSLGTQVALELGLDVFAMTIFGHHGGLTSAGELGSELGRNLENYAEEVADARRQVSEVLQEAASRGKPSLPWGDPLVGEMAVRMVFSALVDADSLDTQAHKEGMSEPNVAAEADFVGMWERFAKRREALLAEREKSPVDSAREALYEACVAAADRPPGMFRLPGLTGTGKTIGAAAFAVRHAALHGKRRVVVATPWTTITEQNADVYRRLLNSDDEQAVLEHHSGVDFDHLGDDRRWQRLAAENWDAPFVTTTTVRLFESLFGRGRTATRRVHRLAGSVIVLDEVQGLPHRLLVPILDGLRTLVDHFGATVVLCSATQPDFWHLEPFKELPAVDIVPEPSAMSVAQHRVRYEWWTNPRPSLEEVATRAGQTGCALTVLNTTADAATVFHVWKDACLPGVFHLSTRMCPAHRRRVLAEVGRRLGQGEPVLLASTQLIEAGVDVDFPTVFRALCPADSISQAAGRCNRDGCMAHGGLVVVFDAHDAGAPPAYRTLTDRTKHFFGADKADPDDAAALLEYWRDAFDVQGVQERHEVGHAIQKARKRLDYVSVTNGPFLDVETGARDHRKAFRMIPDANAAVICPEGAREKDRDDVRELVAHVRAGRDVGQNLRRLQPYITNLHVGVAQRPHVSACLRPVLGDVGTPGSLAEWIGAYDADTGINIDPQLEEFIQ